MYCMSSQIYNDIAGPCLLGQETEIPSYLHTRATSAAGWPPLVQMHIMINALFKQWWPPKQHPGKKSGHMSHLLCHQGPLGTVCLQQDSDHMYLWPGYHLHHHSAKHGYFCVVKESTREQNGTLLSSVMRVGSVCVRVMDGHVYGVDLVRIIFRNAFAHDTQAPSQASWCGGPSITTRGHIWCFCMVK